jgi:6-phosphogluconolactonase
MNGELLVVDDVSAAFAEFVIDRWLARVGPRFAMAMSGGDTARACYEALARRRSEIDWGTVDIWWGDERCVPLDDVESNHRLAHEALLDQVEVGSEHPMTCGTHGARTYESALEDAPPLDLIHLGLGPDGHTASLFPGSAALAVPSSRLVVENVDPTGRNRHPRLTLTYGGIARGRCVVVTVSGAGKSEALRRVRAGDPSAPAAGIDADDVVWLVDPAALDGIGPNGRSTDPR